jgi:hypothetical protein
MEALNSITLDRPCSTSSGKCSNKMKINIRECRHHRAFDRSQGSSISILATQNRSDGYSNRLKSWRESPGAILQHEYKAKSRIRKIGNRLQSRCRGPVSPLSVKGYLEKPDVWAQLLGCRTDDSFDANTSCLRSLLPSLKTKQPTGVKYDKWLTISCYLQTAMHLPRQAELTPYYHGSTDVTP